MTTDLHKRKKKPHKMQGKQVLMEMHFFSCGLVCMTMPLNVLIVHSVINSRNLHKLRNKQGALEPFLPNENCNRGFGRRVFAVQA